ncbi:MAG: type II secretion system F family protein [DPANN group archaeon]|nr:type II secretion system F family protein [DPANN group archaeon]
MIKLPFLPISIERLERISRVFLGVGKQLEGMFPFLESDLIQLEEDIEAKQYLSIAIIASIYGFVMALVLTYLLVTTTLSGSAGQLMIYIPVAGLVLGLVTFLQTVYYPRLLLQKKAKRLNRDLLFALRHILVQLNSGVPLYESMVSVASGDYGVVSEEFGKAIKEITSGGVSQTDALENMIVRTPSTFLRRAVWQISNALKAGSDLVMVMSDLVKDFSEEQRVTIQRFGRELSPWALMYLLLTVVFPSMGVALIIILSSFIGFEVGADFLLSLTGAFIAMQFFFIKFLKSKRPDVRI